jgi:L-fuconolactonase
MATLRRDFTASDLHQEMRRSGYGGCVAVQARQSEAETDFLLQESDKHDFILGVVGWLDLMDPQLDNKLKHYRQHKKFKGLRHVLPSEPNERYMLQEAFLSGISQLEQHDLSYDLLIFPQHLPHAIELVSQFPRQRFVLDHIAKPSINEGELQPWAKNIEALARFSNVYCKFSGMVTEADWGSWSPNQLEPYLAIVHATFGSDRVMIGSDWPVCTLAAEYGRVMQLVETFLPDPEDQKKTLSQNAIDFYQLNTSHLIPQT